MNKVPLELVCLWDLKVSNLPFSRRRMSCILLDLCGRVFYPLYKLQALAPFLMSKFVNVLGAEGGIFTVYLLPTCNASALFFLCTLPRCGPQITHWQCVCCGSRPRPLPPASSASRLHPASAHALCSHLVKSPSCPSHAPFWFCGPV